MSSDWVIILLPNRRQMAIHTDADRGASFSYITNITLNTFDDIDDVTAFAVEYVSDGHGTFVNQNMATWE